MWNIFTKKTVPQIISPNEPTQFEVKILEDGGINSIDSVSLSFIGILETKGGILFDHDVSEIIWQKEGNVKVLDSNHLLDNVNVETNIIDSKYLNVKFNVIFSKNTTSIFAVKTHIIDDNKNAKKNYFENMLLLKTKNTITSTSEEDMVSFSKELSQNTINKYEALDFFDGLRLIEAERRDALNAKANVHLEFTEFNKVIDILEELSNDPQHEQEALIDLGYVKSKMGLNDQAENLFNSAQEVSSENDILVRNNIAISLFLQEKYDECLSDLNEILDDYPSEITTLSIKSLILAILGDYEKSEKIINSLLLSGSGKVDRLIAGAIIQLEHYENPNLAYVYITAANKIEPTPYTLTLQSKIAHDLKDSRMATNTFELIPKVYGVPTNFIDEVIKVKYYNDGFENFRLQIAQDYFYEGEYEIVLLMTDNYLNKHRDSSIGLLLKANSLNEMGQLIEAISVYQKILSVEPANADANYGLLEAQNNLMNEFQYWLKIIGFIMTATILSFAVYYHFWEKNNKPKTWTRSGNPTQSIGVNYGPPKTRFGVIFVKKKIHVTNLAIEISLMMLTILLVMWW